MYDSAPRSSRGSVVNLRFGSYLAQHLFRWLSIVEIQLKFPLRDLLRGASTGSYSQAQLAELHRLGLTIACRYIQRKIFSGKLRPLFFGLSERDIAIDCIAELYGREEDNKLSGLSGYFQSQGIEIEEETDEVLLIHIRKLIFTTVNDNLFRMYNEIDPAVGKILRNLKNAVGKSAEFRMVESFGEHYLVMATCDPLAHLPTIDDATLEQEISGILAGADDIPELLKLLAGVMSSQDSFQRRIRLMSLAALIKAGYRKMAAPGGETVRPDTVGLLDDARRTIHEECRKISDTLESRYVGKGKMSSETFRCYMKAIEQVLISDFLDSGEGSMTYFEALHAQLPELTTMAYRDDHRTIFEYLAKMAKDAVRRKLKEM